MDTKLVSMNALKAAAERLRQAEVEVLKRIAKDAKPEDRKEYRDIRDTLKAMDSEVHSQTSLVLKILRRLHIVP